MRRLTDSERILALEALIENQREVFDGDRRDNPVYLALVQTVDELKKRGAERALDVESYLARALSGLDVPREHGTDYRPGLLRDVALKTRSYWPVIREALRKYGFTCATPENGGCARWPNCGCDPYANAVLKIFWEQGGIPDDVRKGD